MATFTWSPSYNFKKKSRSNVVEAQFDDGYSQRQQVGINAQAFDYSLSFNNRKQTEADAIDAFLTARGGSESFDWTPPSGTAGKYICRSGKWSSTRISATMWTITAEFEQVFEP